MQRLTRSASHRDSGATDCDNEGKVQAIRAGDEQVATVVQPEFFDPC
jgi:hypothetical protein